MKGYIALMLGITFISLTLLFGFHLFGRLQSVETQLKEQTALAIKYKSRYEACKSQLGAFYRDPCKDNPKLDICE